jgi:hypothetical protein
VPAQSKPLRQHEVAFAVANDVATLGDDWLGRDIAIDHRGAGLAAGAAIRFAMRADENRVEGDSLRRKDLQQEFLRAVEAILRKVRRAQAVLVRHHDEGIPGVAQAQEGGNDAARKPEFRE